MSVRIIIIAGNLLMQVMRKHITAKEVVEEFKVRLEKWIW